MLSTLFCVLMYCSALMSFLSVFRYLFVSCTPLSDLILLSLLVVFLSNMFVLIIQLSLNGRYCCLFDEFIITHTFLYVNIFLRFFSILFSFLFRQNILSFFTDKLFPLRTCPLKNCAEITFNCIGQLLQKHFQGNRFLCTIWCFIVLWKSRNQKCPDTAARAFFHFHQEMFTKKL